MRPYITGSKPAEERKLDFCVGAKICSGKAKDREEAKAICSIPKEPKEPKARKTRGKANCAKEMQELANQVAPKINMEPSVLSALLEESACGKVSSTTKLEKKRTEMTPEQTQALETIVNIQNEFNEKGSPWGDKISGEETQE